MLDEYGIVIRQDIQHARTQLPVLLADEENDLTPLMRQQLTFFMNLFVFLTSGLTNEKKF